MIADVSAMMGFICGIDGPQLVQVVRQVEVRPQQVAEFLAHPLGFHLQRGEYDLAALAAWSRKPSPGRMLASLQNCAGMARRRSLPRWI